MKINCPPLDKFWVTFKNRLKSQHPEISESLLDAKAHLAWFRNGNAIPVDWDPNTLHPIAPPPVDESKMPPVGGERKPIIEPATAGVSPESEPQPAAPEVVPKMKLVVPKEEAEPQPTAKIFEETPRRKGPIQVPMAKEGQTPDVTLANILPKIVFSDKNSRDLLKGTDREGEEAYAYTNKKTKEVVVATDAKPAHVIHEINHNFLGEGMEKIPGFEAEIVKWIKNPPQGKQKSYWEYGGKQHEHVGQEVEGNLLKLKYRSDGTVEWTNAQHEFIQQGFARVIFDTWKKMPKEGEKAGVKPKTKLPEGQYRSFREYMFKEYPLLMTYFVKLAESIRSAYEKLTRSDKTMYVSQEMKNYFLRISSFIDYAKFKGAKEEDFRIWRRPEKSGEELDRLTEKAKKSLEPVLPILGKDEKEVTAMHNALGRYAAHLSTSLSDLTTMTAEKYGPARDAIKKELEAEIIGKDIPQVNRLADSVLIPVLNKMRANITQDLLKDIKTREVQIPKYSADGRQIPSDLPKMTFPDLLRSDYMINKFLSRFVPKGLEGLSPEEAKKEYTKQAVEAYSRTLLRYTMQYPSEDTFQWVAQYVREAKKAKKEVSISGLPSEVGAEEEGEKEKTPPIHPTEIPKDVQAPRGALDALDLNPDALEGVTSFDDLERAINSPTTTLQKEIKANIIDTLEGSGQSFDDFRKMVEVAKINSSLRGDIEALIPKEKSDIVLAEKGPGVDSDDVRDAMENPDSTVVIPSIRKRTEEMMHLYPNLGKLAGQIMPYEHPSTAEQRMAALSKYPELSGTPTIEAMNRVVDKVLADPNTPPADSVFVFEEILNKTEAMSPIRPDAGTLWFRVINTFAHVFNRRWSDAGRATAEMYRTTAAGQVLITTSKVMDLQDKALEDPGTVKKVNKTLRAIKKATTLTSGEVRTRPKEEIEQIISEAQGRAKIDDATPLEIPKNLTGKVIADLIEPDFEEYLIQEASDLIADISPNKEDSDIVTAETHTDRDKHAEKLAKFTKNYVLQELRKTDEQVPLSKLADRLIQEATSWKMMASQGGYFTPEKIRRFAERANQRIFDKFRPEKAAEPTTGAAILTPEDEKISQKASVLAKGIVDAYKTPVKKVDLPKSLLSKTVSEFFKIVLEHKGVLAKEMVKEILPSGEEVEKKVPLSKQKVIPPAPFDVLKSLLAPGNRPWMERLWSEAQNRTEAEVRQIPGANLADFGKYFMQKLEESAAKGTFENVIKTELKERAETYKSIPLLLGRIKSLPQLAERIYNSSWKTEQIDQFARQFAEEMRNKLGVDTGTSERVAKVIERTFGDQLKEAQLRLERRHSLEAQAARQLAATTEAERTQPNAIHIAMNNIVNSMVEAGVIERPPKDEIPDPNRPFQKLKWMVNVDTKKEEIKEVFAKIQTLIQKNIKALPKEQSGRKYKLYDSLYDFLQMAPDEFLAIKGATQKQLNSAIAEIMRLNDVTMREIVYQTPETQGLTKDYLANELLKRVGTTAKIAEGSADWITRSMAVRLNKTRLSELFKNVGKPREIQKSDFMDKLVKRISLGIFEGDNRELLNQVCAYYDLPAVTSDIRDKVREWMVRFNAAKNETNNIYRDPNKPLESQPERFLNTFQERRFTKELSDIWMNQRSLGVGGKFVNASLIGILTGVSTYETVFASTQIKTLTDAIFSGAWEAWRGKGNPIKTIGRILRAATGEYKNTFTKDLADIWRYNEPRGPVAAISSMSKSRTGFEVPITGIPAIDWAGKLVNKAMTYTDNMAAQPAMRTIAALQVEDAMGKLDLPEEVRTLASAIAVQDWGRYDPFSANGLAEIKRLTSTLPKGSEGLQKVTMMLDENRKALQQSLSEQTKQKVEGWEEVGKAFQKLNPREKFEVYRRVLEIQYNDLDKEERSESQRYLRASTFRGGERAYPTFMGSLADAVKNFVADKPALQLLIPFTQILSTTFDETTNYTLWGAKRAFWMERQNLKMEIQGLTPKYTAREIGVLKMKAAVGTAATVGVFASALMSYANNPDDPDFEITAKGPTDPAKKNQLREPGGPGFQDYSIKVGGKWYSYRLSPFMLPFAVLGGIMDYWRYERAGKPEPTDMLSIAASGVSGLMKTLPIIVDQTYLVNIQDLFTAIATESSDTREQKMARITMRMATMPIPNILRQINKVFDPSLYQVGKDQNVFVGELLRNIPMPAAWKGNLLLRRMNAFGEEVILDNPSFLLSALEHAVQPPNKQPLGWGRLIVPSQKTDPVWTFVARHDVRIPLVNADEKIMNIKMSDDMRQDYIRIRGQLLRNVLEPLAREDVLGTMKQEDIQKIVARLSSQVSHTAKAILLSNPIHQKALMNQMTQEFLSTHPAPTR